MKVLFIGDSLIEGIVGENFLEIVSKQLPQVSFINRGLGGDTIKNVINRLIRELEKHSYDCVFFAAGHNDILLPVIRKRSQLWERFVSQIIKGGAVLTESDDELIANLNMMINMMAKRDIPFVVSTLCPLGEELDSQLNVRRMKINDAIRHIDGIELCDVGKSFDQVLAESESSGYLMESLIKLVGDDVERSRKGDSMQMSAERTLALTIDGAHLNRRGAEIYADLIVVKLSQMGIE
jgi:lysophospholipase L1-like esterase